MIRSSDIARRREGRVTLLQISDLHFTSRTRVEAGNKERFLDHFETLLLDHLRSRGTEVDLLIVTGDLIDYASDGADRGISLHNSLAYLQDLCGLLGLEKPQESMTVVPGNHDYRWRGISPKELARTDFRKQFADYLDHILYPQLNLFLGAFDSNIAEERVEWARGFVDPSEFDKLTQAVRRAGLEDAFDRAHKLALVHHHPMPVPLAEDRAQSWLEKIVFGKKMEGAAEHMVLKNSGTVLHHLMRSGFQAVFHGHYHQQSHWRTVTGTAEESRALEVVGCRSLCEGPENSHGFNLITLYDEGDLEVEPFAFDHSTLVQKPVPSVATAKYDPVRVEGWRPLRVEEDTAAAVVFWCKEHSLLWQIAFPGGNLTSKEILGGLKVESGELRTLRFFRASTALTADSFVAECSDPNIKPKTKSREVSRNPSEPLELEHILHFSRALTPENTPVNLTILRTTPGVMFHNLEDAKAWGYEAVVDNCTHKVVIPTRKLSLRLLVKSTETAPPDLRAGVWRERAGKSQLDHREISSERLAISGWNRFVEGDTGETRDLAIAVYVPMTGREYGFEWDIPKASEQAQRATNLRLRFWNMTTPADRKEILTQGQEILSDFLEREKFPVTRADSCLVGWTSRTDAPQREFSGERLRDFNPRWGRDIAGTAFRSGLPLTLVRKEHEGHFQPLREIPEEVRSMVALPLGEFDETTGRYRTVVVLVFASTSDEDGLTRLARLKERVKLFDLRTRSLWLGLLQQKPFSAL